MSGAASDQGADGLDAVEPCGDGRTPPVDQPADAPIVLSQVTREDRLMMGDAVPEPSDFLNVAVDLGPCLSDGEIGGNAGKRHAKMLIPKAAVLALHEHVLPECELKSGDDLARRGLALRLTGDVVRRRIPPGRLEDSVRCDRSHG